MKITREFIEIVAPEHQRSSCSDEEPSNGYPNGNGDVRCTRCFLLQAEGAEMVGGNVTKDCGCQFHIGIVTDIWLIEKHKEV